MLEILIGALLITPLRIYDGLGLYITLDSNQFLPLKLLLLKSGFTYLIMDLI